MNNEIIDKLIRIGYTKEQSNECYFFYKERNKLPTLNEFADDILEMMELDRRISDE